MRKYFLVIIPLVLTLMLTASNLFGQSNKTAYLIKTWNYNPATFNHVEKMDSVIQEIKNKTTVHHDFLYCLPVGKGRYILVSDTDNVDGSVVQLIFEPYIIKSNIIKVQEFNNSSVNLSNFPIYSNQDIILYNQKLDLWESTHQESVNALINLFSK